MRAGLVMALAAALWVGGAAAHAQKRPKVNHSINFGVDWCSQFLQEVAGVTGKDIVFVQI